MNGQLFILDFFTNLHVGGLGDNLSVVDKQVQRDPITGYPYIQTSGLKGAIRAYAEAGRMKNENVHTIFGKDGESGKTNASSQQGHVSFLPAHLLLLPLRANRFAYLQATCPDILKQLKDSCGLIGQAESELAKLCTSLLNLWEANQMEQKPQTGLLLGAAPANGVASLRVEGMRVVSVPQDETQNLSLLVPGLDRLLLISDADMKSVVGTLPILAHNKLENGKSVTLWYEEVVPRKTVMYTVMLSNQQDLLDQLATVCGAELQDPVQFGANATLGYGLCTMHKML